MKKVIWMSSAMLIATLAGCATDEMSSNQATGMVLGGLTGGLIGSAFGKGDGKVVAVGVGTLLGAVIGSNIGAKMDQNDRAMAEQAADKAAQAPIGEEIRWNNSQSGNSGSAKTIKIGADAQGHECRQIQQQITVEGKTDVILVDICLIDNHWVVAS